MCAIHENVNKITSLHSVKTFTDPYRSNIKIKDGSLVKNIKNGRLTTQIAQCART